MAVSLGSSFTNQHPSLRWVRTRIGRHGQSKGQDQRERPVTAGGSYGPEWEFRGGVHAVLLKFRSAGPRAASKYSFPKSTGCGFLRLPSHFYAERKLGIGKNWGPF